jgi:hypothetical protein
MHHTPLYSIFDMLQPLRRIHKMGGRTNGTNTERENMKHLSILSLWYPTLFAPRSATQLLAIVLVSGPVAWSEKHNEWEELRVCTADDYHHNMKTPVNWLFIYNQDQKGGEFYVDRVELRRTYPQ